MTTLALDISSKVGWAATDTKGGVVDLTRFKGDFGQLGQRFEEWLSAQFFKLVVTRLVVERPFYRGAGTQIYMLNGLAFIAQKVAFYDGIERAEYTVQDVRKTILGNGRAAKADVMTWAAATGRKPIDDNHADALALLECDRIKRGRAAA